jgi:hypothetical protein
VTVVNTHAVKELFIEHREVNVRSRVRAAHRVGLGGASRLEFLHLAQHKPAASGEPNELNSEN